MNTMDYQRLTCFPFYVFNLYREKLLSKVEASGAAKNLNAIRGKANQITVSTLHLLQPPTILYPYIASIDIIML